MTRLNLTDRSITLREISVKDNAILLAIYGSTRKEEMERVPQWSDLMKEEFIRQQFEAQHTHYQNNYRGANFWVIEQKNKILGRLYVQENFQNASVRIIDITLLPEHRKQGIGTTLLSDMQNWSAAMDKPLTIHVESFNPAKRLYERLGFKKISETNGVYHLMEWKQTI